MRWKSALVEELSGSLRPGKKSELITGRKLFGGRNSIGRGTIGGYRMAPDQRMQRLHYTMACAKWGTLSAGDKEAYEAWATANNVTVFSSFLHSYLASLRTALRLYVPIESILDSTIKDYSIYENHGTNTNCTLQMDEFIGNCLKCPTGISHSDHGTDTSLNLTDELTLSGWAKPKNLSAYGYLINRNDTGSPDRQYSIQLSSANVISFATQGSAWPTGVTVPEDKWTHIAGIAKSGQYRRVYVNGFLVASTTSSVITSVVKHVSIGCRWGAHPTSSGDFNGLLDELRIYATALTLEELRAMYTIESKWHGDVA